MKPTQILTAGVLLAAGSVATALGQGVGGSDPDQFPAIHGKVDLLKGLKENVIMGRLIPAGTGLPKYSKAEIELEEPEGGEPEVPEAAEA